MNGTQTLVNGIPCDHVAASDRGLQFGDGVFETMPCRDGVVAWWPQHFTRLQQGAQRLGIDCPQQQLLLDDMRQLAAATPRCVIKIILTRGSSERGYAVGQGMRPRRIVRASSLPEYPAELYRQGIAATYCEHRLALNPALAGIKHLNRLDNVMARRELGSQHHEGIMRDMQGNVIEGTMSNLFLVRAGELVTADLGVCGVDGIIRRQLLDIARQQGIGCHVGALLTADVEAADELFFCNSLIGIWPVSRLDERHFAAGPVTAMMTALLDTAETQNGLEL